MESSRMIQFYVDRGYPQVILRRFAKQARKLNQVDLLQTKNKENNNRPIMVTQYNTRNPDINKWQRTGIYSIQTVTQQ